MAVYRDPSLLANPAAGWTLVRRSGAAGPLRWFPRLVIVPHVLVLLWALTSSAQDLATGVMGAEPGREAIALAALVSLLVSGILGKLVLDFWLPPLRARWLYRRGAASPGTVVAKRAPGGAIFELDYVFTLPGGSRHEATMRVSSRRLFDSVDVDERVTVLHPPHRPGPSLIYDCGDHRWAGDTTTR